MARFVVLLLVTALGVPVSVLAQAPEQAPSVPATVDVSKLGVDLSRIKRELGEPPSAELSDSALKMSFTVQVIGVAPKIDFLRGFAIDGPIPYGAPTHQEIIQVLTPQAYRSPVVPIYGLAIAAAQKLFQNSKKSKCEIEIAEYRAMVMQGIAVTAPRCTQ